MSKTKTESKDWNDAVEDNKKLIKTIYGKMGGNKTDLIVKKLEWSMEVKHTAFEEAIHIPRRNFDDNNVHEIEKCLSSFIK
ncbi:MAG: hypothetical protein CVU51_06495 [Deltaproteobacteria bacterium HGW-Deltaproteobacteria-1]|jgi:hypothetical protein|nr:MAG: hypothetical protein CVU51_06495 [Deltaproteobacteria bacterium HGW-Deltaproteobacteria-1]